MTRRHNKRRNNWIAGAIKHPKKLWTLAKRAGTLTRRGTIKLNWLRNRAAKGDKAAQLALTLRKLRKGQWHDGNGIC